MSIFVGRNRKPSIIRKKRTLKKKFQNILVRISRADLYFSNSTLSAVLSNQFRWTLKINIVNPLKTRWTFKFRSTEISISNKEGIIEKKFYDHRVYESVDDRSLS